MSASFRIVFFHRSTEQRLMKSLLDRSKGVAPLWDSLRDFEYCLAGLIQ
jgi:hypothetical protein